MDLISDFVNKFNEKEVCIHVIGDSMIDVEYQVKVSRISPECPNVNILLSEDDLPCRKLPGGAANVCYQLNNFNVVSRLFTFIDLEAYQIIRNYGIKYWGAIFLPKNCYVPRKRRFYEKGFQVVARIDIEKSRYGLDDATIRWLQSNLCRNWPVYQIEPHVIIFSDYNKGIFSNDFKLKWFKTEAITIVDPKALPLERWEGCTIFKPNAKEAEFLSGLKNWKDQCNFFQKKLNCHAVVITREGDGVVGKEGEDYFEYNPNIAIKPLDIIGAGDCFIAILGLAVGYGFSVKDAAQIAFHGGLTYVQQRQRGMFGPWSFHSNGKIVDIDKIIKLKSVYKEDFTFTNGCFDGGLTLGHIECLKYAKSLGHKLIVGINSDESVERLKGVGRPIFKLNDRMKIVAALEYVDFVVPFEEDTPLSVIEKILPKFVVKGGDYKPEDVVGFGLTDVVICPRYDCSSTTDKIKAILNENTKA